MLLCLGARLEDGRREQTPQRDRRLLGIKGSANGAAQTTSSSANSQKQFTAPLLQVPLHSLSKSFHTTYVPPR
jgi:hypothetical protein